MDDKSRVYPNRSGSRTRLLACFRCFLLGPKTSKMSTDLLVRSHLIIPMRPLYVKEKLDGSVYCTNRVHVLLSCPDVTMVARETQRTYSTNLMHMLKEIKLVRLV